MSPLSRLNAAADAVNAAATRLTVITESDVPAELAAWVSDTAATVQSTARQVRSAAFEWERAADTFRTLAAITAAVILARFAWDVVKDLRDA